LVFVPAKRKSKNILAKFFCFQKIPDPTFFADMVCFGHVAVADCATFATWQFTSLKIKNLFFKTENQLKNHKKKFQLYFEI